MRVAPETAMYKNAKYISIWNIHGIQKCRELLSKYCCFGCSLHLMKVILNICITKRRDRLSNCLFLGYLQQNVGAFWQEGIKPSN